MTQKHTGGMPLRIRHEQLVRAPLAAVWAACADPVRQTAWQTGLQSVEMLTPEPFGPGSWYRLHMRVAGTRVPVDVEVLEVVAPRLLTHRVHYTKQKFTTLDRCELVDVGDGVLTTTSSWFERVGAVQLAMSRATRFLEVRRYHRAAARFAAVVEQG